MSKLTKEQVSEGADAICKGLQRVFDLFGPDWMTDNAELEAVEAVAVDLGLQPALYYLSGFSGLGFYAKQDLAWAISPTAQITASYDSEDFHIEEQLGWSATKRSVSQALAAISVYRELTEKTALAVEILRGYLGNANRVSRNMTASDRREIFEEVRRRKHLLADEVKAKYNLWHEHAPAPKLVFTQVTHSTEPAWKFSPLRTLGLYKDQTGATMGFARYRMDRFLEELGWVLKAPVYFFPQRNLVETTLDGETKKFSWDPAKMVRMTGGNMVVEPINT